MRTYVAEIDGEAIMAFRAEGDDEAYDIVNEENGGLQLGLNGYSGLLRTNGRPLWDEQSEIKARPATDDEHKRWVNAPRDSEEAGDDPDDFNVYLIPTIPGDKDEDKDIKIDELNEAVDQSIKILEESLAYPARNLRLTEDRIRKVLVILKETKD
jgi:hypothetical protein